MKRKGQFSVRPTSIRMILYAALAAATLLVGTPAMAAITVPVMVDYFDTAAAGATNPQGVAQITSGALVGHFAVVDSTADEVYIFDPDGILKSQFDTGALGSTNPQGITYISSGPYEGNFALVDNSADKIFVVDTSGVLQNNAILEALGASVLPTPMESHSFPQDPM